MFEETESKVMDEGCYLRDPTYFPVEKNVRFPLPVILWVLQTCLLLGVVVIPQLVQHPAGAKTQLVQ
jgi:hypothetical protein